MLGDFAADMSNASSCQRAATIAEDLGIVAQGRHYANSPAPACQPELPSGRANNDQWILVAVHLLDGRWFRALTLVDQFTCECLLRSLAQWPGIRARPVPGHRRASVPVSITVDNCAMDARESGNRGPVPIPTAQIRSSRRIWSNIALPLDTPIAIPVYAILNRSEGYSGDRALRIV